MKPAKKKPGRPRSRRGSALVIVLGMLAVMTLMGIAFSTFIRTERAGMTGLKNNLVARQALHTAVGRVMEAIDLSYGDVSNDWPVCVWPNPWLSSSNSEEQDYFQSAAVGSGERPIARIVTKEIADMLTPSQLWLARSAQVGWAPIDASIETSRELSRKTKPTSQYGNTGLDGSDSVIGRYAFVAIETTGLLGVNDVGDPAQKLEDRAASAGADPSVFILPQSEKTAIASSSGDDRAIVYDGGTAVPIPTVLKNAKGFLGVREAMDGEFFPTVSTAFSAATNNLNLKVPNPSESALSHGLFPADMFASFAPSLEDLDPDGMPKVGLPGTNEISSATAKTVGTFGARAMLAMAKVFANASFDEESTAGDSEDSYTFFSYGTGGGNKKYTLSRARLATVALLDAMDPDVIPGRWYKNKDATGSPLYSAWQTPDEGGLPYVSGVKTSVAAANGDYDTVSVSDSLSFGAANRRGNEGALNFPCTEPVPMVNRVYAYMTVDPPNQADWHEGDGSNSYVRVHGKFHVGAVASLKNIAETANARKDKYKMSVECSLLLTTPVNSVGSVKNAPVPKNILEKMVGVPDPDDPFAFQGRKRVWIVDDLELELGGGDDVMDVFVNSATEEVSDSRTGNKIFSADGEMPFEVKLYASAYPDEGDPDDPFGGGGSGEILGDPNVVGGIKHGDYTYFPLTDAEGTPDDLYLPFRFRVKIRHVKSNVEVQRVPAPVLDDNDGTFWLRADAALYHAPDSLFEGEKDSETPPWQRDYAPGWAVCLDPAFAFDTSCLWCSSGESNWEIPDSSGFWLNNRLALDVETRPKGKNDPPEWTRLKTAFKNIRKLYDNHRIGEGLVGFNEDQLTGGPGPDDPYAKSLWNVAQTDGLFDTESSFALATAFMAPGAKTVPDNLHAYKANGHLTSGQCLYRDGGPFCMLKSGKPHTSRILSGLYSHVQNAPFKSVGQLGDVMVGPYETLATVRAYRFGTKRADIHRVLDYFTTGDDRYPAKADYGATGGPAVRNDGTVDYEDCTELFSGVHAGLVNLNTPPVLRWTDKKKTRVKQAEFGGDKIHNPYPIAAGLAGANLYSDYHSANISTSDRAMPQDMALDIATAIATTAGVDIENDDSFPVLKKVKVIRNGKEVEEYQWVYDSDKAVRRVKTRLSDIGAAEDGGINPILESVVEQIAEGPTTVQTEVVDADREAFVANSSGAFTTRGQTFLVIIRADAYTPRYGEETAEDGEGTTLATTHAVVELFRDPVFARFPDGKPLSILDKGNGNTEVDREGAPVYFHNWYIKSMRIL